MQTTCIKYKKVLTLRVGNDQKNNKLEVGKSGGEKCIWRKRSSVGVLAGPSWETEPRKLSEAHTYLKASSLGGDGTEELGCVSECPEFTTPTTRLDWGELSHRLGVYQGDTTPLMVKALKGFSPVPEAFPVNTIQLTQGLWSYTVRQRGLEQLRKNSLPSPHLREEIKRF